MFFKTIVIATGYIENEDLKYIMILGLVLNLKIFRTNHRGMSVNMMLQDVTTSKKGRDIFSAQRSKYFDLFFFFLNLF